MQGNTYQTQLIGCEQKMNVDFLLSEKYLLISNETIILLN
jgi:hypothetical protein